MCLANDLPSDRRPISALQRVFEQTAGHACMNKHSFDRPTSFAYCHGAVCDAPVMNKDSQKFYEARV